MFRIRHIAAAAALMLAAGEPALAQTDWATYGFDSVRTNYNPFETLLSPTTVANLKQTWAFKAGAFDRSIDPLNKTANAFLRGQAVVASGINVAGTPTDLVFLGDNNGTFFALDLNSTNPGGKVVWYKSLGTVTTTVPTSMTFGVFGAAAFDRAAQGGQGAVYVATNGVVHAFDPGSGTELNGWPIAIVPDPTSPTDGRIHSGVNVVNGQLYTTTGANGSDTRPFYGRVVRIDTTGPSVSGKWYTLSGSATQPVAFGGGIWGWGGVAIDPTAPVGGVYFATGNSFTGTGQSPAFAERVVNVSPDLTSTVGHASPVLAAGDNDYGSSPTVFKPNGCKSSFLTVKNKTGILVLEGISPAGGLAVAQTIQVSAPPTDTVNGDKFRGTTAWDPVNQQVLVTSIADGPAPYLHGLSAFKFNPACKSPYLSLAWQANNQINGQPVAPNGTEESSPALANGVAYFGAGSQNSIVFAVSLANGPGVTAGQVLWQSPTLTGCTANTTPSVVNGRLIVPCAGIVPTVYAFSTP